MLRYLLAGLALCVGLNVAGYSGEPPKKNVIKSPLSPKEAVRHFHLADERLRIELVACEPQIESPVAMAFDENGKLWVVEMRDYPNGPAPGEPPAGRIRILEDKDGDGFFETSTIFADKLLFANGLLPWKGGVIVTAAPHILYLKDTDGDGKADVKEILYEGFATQNPQLRVSSPILGVDGWIYVVNGLRGGQIIRHGKKDAKPISLAGMDFRFDMINDRAEAISGLGQYGNTFDDWGNRFVCDNRHHLRHVVMESGYLKRNPYLAAPGVVEDISVLDDGPLSSGGKIYPISSNWTTSNLHEGRFTAACGVFIYRETLLPKPFQGAAFTCDPTGNLVHAETMEQNGATFRARPIFKEKEFLASPDDWFRPVFLTSGPDGAMYVVDMYRAVIEHPEFMPPELKNRPDLTLGKEKGRIWRIVPENKKTKAIRPELSKATSPELVELLCHEHGWYRTTAQRLLLQKQDKAATKELEELCRDKKKDSRGRLHAAYLLYKNWLGAGLIPELLTDPNPRLREHAVAMYGFRTPNISAELVLNLGDDTDPRVRFQVALTLGDWDHPQWIIEELAKVAIAGAEDKWTRLAVASSLRHGPEDLLKNLLHNNAFMREFTPGRKALIKELAALMPSAGVDVRFAKLKSAFELPGEDHKRWHITFLDGLRRGTLGDLRALAYMGSDDLVPTVRKLDALVRECGRRAGDAKLAVADRLECIRLLPHGSWSQMSKALVPLLTDESPQEIRLAAVRSIAAFRHDEVAEALMKPWRSYSPAVRREVTEAMFREYARLQYLLKEIEAKRVKPGDIDAVRTRQLLKHAKADIRDKARKLLAENIPADRNEVLARYQKALDLKGDAAKGREIFKKNCAACHRIAGIGIDVAPDISDTRTKTPPALLVDILNPNAAIDNNYINYLVTTKSGKSLSGVITAETAASLTLKRAEGQSDVVLRQDIDEIQSTGVSLMPDGLEKTITIAQMADLLSFLKNWRYLDGAVPVAP